jgi:type VI secretion system ImpC/EvpB family protein/type VI secretion system ImpB/VipA family protein
VSDIKGFKVGFGDSGDREAESGRGPLRIVVVSGVTAGPDFTSLQPPASEPVAVDKLSFDSVLHDIAPAFTVPIRDPFTPEAQPFAAELRITDLKGLRPDGLAEQLPVLRALLEARKVVLDVRARRIKPDDARVQLARILPRRAWADALAEEVGQARATINTAPTLPAPATTPPPAKPADPLDALFEKVGVKGDDDKPAPAAPEAEKPTAGGLSAIVAAVAKGGRNAPAKTPAVVGTALERVERAFTRILCDVLRHPEVRRIERAWRGLRLLVDHADRRAGVEIDLVPAQKDQIEAALQGLLEPTASNAERAPVDLIIVDHEFGSSAEDGQLLAAWAKAGEALHAPVCVNGNASLLGLASIDELPKSAKRLAGFQDPRPAHAREAAGDEAARWLAVVMNGPLVRAAYTPSSARLRDVPFTEEAKERANHVFAGPAIAIGVLCARSYVTYGWPTAIVGAKHGEVPNLPVYELEERGHVVALPLEVFVGDDVIREAARAGVTVLGCAPNRDSAILQRAPTFHKKGAAAPEASLPDQLFVGRFASAVQQVAAAIPPNVDPTKGAQVARAALDDLFEAPGGPEISAKIALRRLEVTIRPRRYAGVAIEEFSLAAPLGE